jgi:hypothetical protein
MAGLCGAVLTGERSDNAAAAAIARTMLHHAGLSFSDAVGDGWRSGVVAPLGGSAATILTLPVGAAVAIAGSIVLRDPRFGDLAQAFTALSRMLDEDSADLGRWFAGVDGCFAFALIDPERRMLLLANDRHGGLPIYTGRSAAGLFWASEAKAVAASVGDAVDPAMLERFVARGWLQPPFTHYRGVAQLPPRSALLVRWPEMSERAIEVYPPQAILQNVSMPIDEAKAQFATLLTEAVRARIATAASGDIVVTLSGGLDSRLLAAEARKFGTVRTVTYGQPRSPELALAAQVARKLGVAHEIVPIDHGNWLTGRDGAIWMTDGMQDVSHAHIMHVAQSIAGAGIVLDGLFGDVVLGRGAITVDPAADEATNRHLRINRFTYFGPRIEQNFAAVATPLIDEALVDFMDGLDPALTGGGRLYREAAGMMHPDVFTSIPWLKTGAYPSPYRPHKWAAAQRKSVRRISQLSRWTGLPIGGSWTTMDYFGWYRGKDFQRLYRALVDGSGAMLRDQIAVPDTAALFSRLPSPSRLQQITRVLTLEVWLRQVAAGRAVSWDEMLDTAETR